MPSPGSGDRLLHGYVATGQDRAAQWEAVYSIAPRTKAPVVREFVDDDGEVQRSLELARWGWAAPVVRSGLCVSRRVPFRGCSREHSRPG